MRVLEPFALLLLLLGFAAEGRSLLNCADDDICTTEGFSACPGHIFYSPGCMPSTCRCAAGGGVMCTKMACATQCESDNDCAAIVRSATAQPDLHPLCQCEARSTVERIASHFDECLGEDPEAGVKCARARCAYTCEGVAAVCSSEGRCELSEQGEEKKEALL